VRPIQRSRTTIVKSCLARAAYFRRGVAQQPPRFPTSACHGLGRYQLDPSARLIWLLEKAALGWDVVRISPQRMERNAP